MHADGQFRNVAMFAYSTKQKQFLYDEFIYGEQTGRKTTAVKVVEKMKSMKDDNNEKVFSPSEYLSEKQVLSAFSRMSKLYKDGRLERPVEATRSSYAKVNETEEITSNNEDTFQGDE